MSDAVTPTMSVAELTLELHTDVDRGLTASEAQHRLERCGPNELVEAPPPSLARRFGSQFDDPLVWLLLAAIIISGLAWWVDGADTTPVEVIVIAVIVLANAIVGVWQEGRAIDAVAALRALGAPQSVVRRDGLDVRIPTRELVVGDLITVSEGDAIGADARLVESWSLEVSEAALTGESVPVSKSPGTPSSDAVIADRADAVFSGTAVTRGRGRAIVTATGEDTEIGRIASMLAGGESVPTPLRRQIDRLSRLLGAVVIALGIVMVVAIALTSEVDSVGDALDALLVAVSLAVAAVPEGLPAILTVVLALGVQRMAGHDAIVKRLLSVETLGSASVVCTDKTGTLTRNEMTVVTIATASGSAHLSGVGYEPVGTLSVDSGEVPTEVVENETAALLWAAAAVNDASLGDAQTGEEVRGDPTEVALLVAAEKVGVRGLAALLSRTGEVPFDAKRKLMSSVHPTGDWGPMLAELRPTAASFVQFTKGAPDVLLGRCDRVVRAGVLEPLDAEERERIGRAVESFARTGLRTLGVAMLIRPALPEPLDASIENGLVLLGIVGIVDPAKPEAKAVIAQAAGAGIRTVMLTGDHPKTARAIAESLGMAVSDESVMSGPELDAAQRSGDEVVERLLDDRIESTTAFARVSPEHKLLIVDAFQRAGHVVAMTGDGVNDGPALRRADIGVAMGQNGTEVAREASDMILADDDIGTIVHAVREGREIFADVRKFLRYLLASNAGEVLVMLVGVLAAVPIGLTATDGELAVPLLATQILWINLLTDSGLALALGVDPSVDDVMRNGPRHLDDPIIDRTMAVTIAVVGVTTAIAGLVALDLELVGGMLGGSGDIETARTMAFTTVVLAQVFNAFNSRSDTTSAFVRMFDNRLLWAAAGSTVLLQIAVVHLPVLNRAFETEPLDARRWTVCAALATLVLIVEEVRKVAVRWRHSV
jgi:magnesium-transporting ATPase (P-type)